MKLKPPADDVELRVPVWSELQMLFMDTDAEDHVPSIVRECAASPYSVEDLEEILYQEVLPALRPNLMSVAGEWRGFQSDDLRDLILEKHRFGKGRPVFFRTFVAEWWEKLRPQIVEARAAE